MDNKNIFSTPFKKLRNFLVDNIQDPRGRFKSNWVHNSMPLINDKSFNGFPFIVVKINLTEAVLSLDRDTSEKQFTATISIYSTDGEELDKICDSIYSQFKDDYKLNFASKKLTNSPMDWFLNEHGKKVLYRNLNLLFKERI